MENFEEDKIEFQKYLDGDQKAFEYLILKYKDNLIYFILRYVKKIEIAEDLAQDVFVYVMLHKDQYNFSFSFKTYLFMIGKSRALNYLKKEGRITEEKEDIESIEDLEQKVLNKEKLEIIEKQIEDLKPSYLLSRY